VPSVSLVILNYNGRQWIDGCLTGVASQRGAPEYETLLIDNGSRDESVNFARTKYPDVRVIELTRNLGFAGGNNAGARQTSGDWIAFLNNDAAPDAGWLAALWTAAQANPEFRIVTSRLVFMDDPAVVDSAGDGYLRAGGAFKHGHGARTDELGAS